MEFYGIFLEFSGIFLEFSGRPQPSPEPPSAADCAEQWKLFQARFLLFPVLVFPIPGFFFPFFFSYSRVFFGFFFPPHVPGATPEPKRCGARFPRTSIAASSHWV